MRTISWQKSYYYLLCVSGLVLALPVLAIIILAFRLPITFSGIGYLLGCLIGIVGLIFAPWKRRHSITLTIIGILIIAAVANVRLILARQNTASHISMISLPQDKEADWINYLIDEQDSIIFGETLFHWMGGDSASEHENTTAALYTAYSEMRARQKVFPSPFLSTYLNLQRSTHFDAIVIEPDVHQLSKFAIVFLHGYMGNVTSQCWEIAQAVKIFGGVTVCPSTGWQGAWWQPKGEAILQATFDYVKGRGIQRFYLGGFSNGGSGISRLAPQLKDETSLKGLIFIDGIHNGADIRATGLPVLIIQGTHDERMLATEARQVAAEIGDAGTYVELNGDHFLIMKQPKLVHDAIAQWLEKFEERKYATTPY
jgi:pimeloyl-ACP methyl ester carboxylesterase